MRWVSASIAGCLASLVACASGYDLSDQAVRYRASLTDAAALAKVKESASGGAEQQGVCSAHTNSQFEKAEFVSLDGASLVFTSYYTVLAGTSVTGSIAAGTGQVHVLGESRRGTFALGLRDLHKIRVLRDTKGYGCFDGPGRPLGAYIVMLDNPGLGDVSDGRPNGVMINVSERDLDRFIAALSFLSPQARLIQGTGF